MTERFRIKLDERLIVRVEVEPQLFYNFDCFPDGDVVVSVHGRKSNSIGHKDIAANAVQFSKEEAHEQLDTGCTSGKDAL